MMINIVLGAGLLTLPGLAVQAVGAAAPLIWATCALVAVPLLAVFALLGRRWPDAGGLAKILSKGFGQFGYVAGTLLFLGAVLFGLPAIALTGGHYIAAAIGGPAPLYAAGLILAAALINVISVEIAGRINTVLATVLVAALIGVLAVGWAAADPQLPPMDTMTAALPAWNVVGATFMMVFFAFTGWEVAAHLGGDFRNPRRDMPLAMGLSFAVVVLLYGGLALIAQGINSAAHPEAPFATLLGEVFGPAGVWVISGLSVVLIFANLAAAVWAVSRMVFAAANEGLLPAALTAQRRGMPYRAVIVTVSALVSVTIAAWAGAINLSDLLAMAGQNFLLLYAGVAAVLIRRSEMIGEFLLGWICVFITVGLISLRGGEGAMYPLVLLLSAGVLANHRCSKSGAPEIPCMPQVSRVSGRTEAEYL